MRDELLSRIADTAPSVVLARRCVSCIPQYYYSLSCAAECTHPVEFILGNGLPFLFGPFVIGKVHAYTLLAWLVWRVVETCDGHSGFDFPFMPARLMPLASPSGGHDAHHSINTGNYGSFLRVWDWVFGTEIPAEKIDAAIYPHTSGAVAKRR